MVKVGEEWWPKMLSAPQPYLEPSPSQPSRTDTPGRQRPGQQLPEPQNSQMVMVPSSLAAGPSYIVQIPPVPAKPGKAQGKAGAGSSNPKASFSQLRSRVRWFGKVWKSCSSFAALIICLAFWSGQEGPLSQVTSMLRSTAEVTRAAGGAAVMVLETGTAFTASAHTAAVRVAVSGLGAVQLAWSGVDVLDVHFNTSQGRILATGASDLGGG